MSCHGDHCITCSDEAVPMEVLAFDEVRVLALCQSQDGARYTVETLLVGDVQPGDRVLVHAGTAIHKGAEG